MRTVAVQVPAGNKKDSVRCFLLHLTVLFADFVKILFHKKQKLIYLFINKFIYCELFSSGFVDFAFKQESKTFA